VSFLLSAVPVLAVAGNTATPYHRIHHSATGRLDINLGTMLTQLAETFTSIRTEPR
jgi:sterol desaturase/sphingolipid hydroxylase (fatty acid hydroxylase superfamily)